MKLTKDYDCTIEYHPSKANEVADMLSCKPIANLKSIKAMQILLMLELMGLNVGLEVDTSRALLASFSARPLLLWKIYKAQLQDPQLLEAREVAQSGPLLDYIVRRDSLLLFGGCICVLAVESLKELILQEAHGLAYAMHQRSTKMYHNLRESYW